uniref:ADG1 protein n=1 Tax=Trypanosoma brucei TaxID=5691 RepID=Q26716_9TRYP|nr:ADG1 [Trypanosoma brucei brucei]
MVNSALCKTLLEPLRTNPLLGVCVATGCVNAFIYMWYTRSTSRTLRASREKCQAVSENAFAKSRALMKELEEDWARDIKARDASVRRLELQNVEQTRSIARLDAVMKFCLTPGLNRITIIVHVEATFNGSGSVCTCERGRGTLRIAFGNSFKYAGCYSTFCRTLLVYIFFVEVYLCISPISVSCFFFVIVDMVGVFNFFFCFRDGNNSFR